MFVYPFSIIYKLILDSQPPTRTPRTIDSNLRKFSKWGSINTDSGISLFYDTALKNRDTLSVSGSSAASSNTSKAQRFQILPSELAQLNVNNSTQQLDDARRLVMLK